jgi:hypothetical protein
MTPRIRRHANVAFLVLMVVVIGGLNLLWTGHEVGVSQHRWCATIVTLDNADQAALKAPPSQKPHGAYSFALISDFHHLRTELGCG